MDYDEEFEEGDMTLLGNHHTLKKTMQVSKVVFNNDLHVLV